jgi:hypothetical protein
MLVEWVGKESSRVEERQSRSNYRSAALPFYCSSLVTLGLLAAREACREGGTLVVIDRRQLFYPPAAAAWGIDLDRLIVVRPRNARDELWAAVQSLQSPAVAALWAAIDRMDSRAFRRLQLAAQAGRALGVILRPCRARAEPSWADVRLEATNFGLRIADWGLPQLIRNPKSAFRNQIRYAHVLISHCHGGRSGDSAIIGIDDVTRTVHERRSFHDTHPLPVVAKLADSADHSRSARA